MQSRDAPGAQTPGQAAEAATASQHGATGPDERKKPVVEEALDQLAEMAALSWSVKQRYLGQVKLAGQTAKAEWQLTGRSLTVAAALVVCFGAGMILLWGTILLLLGAVLMHFTASLPITAAALLLLQFGVLFWCWRSLGYVLSQAGFSNTCLQLRRLLFSTQEESKDAD
ncbi:hypothetical protein J2X32_000160 [Rheinheimera pacifica]|uniref:hypothetical protein n=1 Tax=Rheinheimera pacifica TaxID=173990 RepID=UPI0026962F80|nr:hypothetical protein [Rheinheimera pacifica]MDR6981552.1 hypothetical protein [Rheinheimera pacifica]